MTLRDFVEPSGVPIALSDDYWTAPAREAHVRAFTRRDRLEVDLTSARGLAGELREFLLPVLDAARQAVVFEKSGGRRDRGNDVRGTVLPPSKLWLR